MAMAQTGNPNLDPSITVPVRRENRLFRSFGSGKASSCGQLSRSHPSIRNEDRPLLTDPERGSGQNKAGGLGLRERLSREIGD